MQAPVEPEGRLDSGHRKHINAAFGGEPGDGTVPSGQQVRAEVDPYVVASQRVELTAEAIVGLEKHEVEMAQGGGRRESGGAAPHHHDVHLTGRGGAQEASHIFLKSALLGLTPVM